HVHGNEVTVLRDKKTKERFKFNVYQDESKNQERYVKLGEAVKNYVHDVCLSGNLKLSKIAIPVDAGKKEPQGFYFISEYALYFKKLIILMHGGGAVRAGQWSRSLIINENLESGTMMPYIEKALEEGFGVILTNGNHNMDSNDRPIQGSESAQDHFVYVWNKFIKDAKAEHIVIVAHSLGGEVVLHGLREIDEARRRINAVAFTHSTHTTIKESTEIKRWLKENARNWVCSEEPLDTPVKIDCKDDCDQVSAGTNEHTMTSHLAKDSVFNFFEEKLSAASSFIKPTQLTRIPLQYQPHELDSVYKMTSSPRGLAVIVNMNNFQPKARVHNRKGSEKDQQGLVNLFEELDFRTKTLVDLTKEELLSEFQDITKYHFGAYDCLIVCIMSHGDEDYFVACDGGKIKTQSIREMFNNKNCETLCGKPKLFFINTCRGELEDPGTVVKESGSKLSVKPQPSPEPKAYTAVENCGRETTAENADILTAFSTVEGYCSYRHEEEGSWFIRSLIEVFREYAGVEDVTDMLIRVNKEVNSKGSLGSKQVPEPRNTLTKKVFFWPGMKFKQY
ncbi:cotranscriptional regulator FAM172A-like, partial [Actinia tenebrosa]|uniref:Cotranscriptional regulator FAM172A-like n=1 Tax=Actinia tenebrosa TaxID=6105 RepID=A0A6P8HM04_ACTTE